MSALYTVNQAGKPAGDLGRARRDIDLGVITVECPDPYTTYLWESVSSPIGVDPVITSPTDPTTDITLSERGGYLLRLTVDEGLPTEDISVLYIGIALLNSGLCLPALSETIQDNSQFPYDGRRGAEDKLYSLFCHMDSQVGLFEYDSLAVNPTLTTRRKDFGAVALGDGSYAFGSGAEVYSANSYALGDDIKIHGENSSSIGRSNYIGTTSLDSPNCFIFGVTNYVGIDPGYAENCYVSGSGNAIGSTYAVECHAIGHLNQIALSTNPSAQCFVFGYQNIISGEFGVGQSFNCYVVGAGNRLGDGNADCVWVLGNQNYIGVGSAVNCAVIGISHNIGAVYAQSCYVFGESIQVGMAYSAAYVFAMGMNLILDGNIASSYILGEGNSTGTNGGDTVYLYLYGKDNLVSTGVATYVENCTVIGGANYIANTGTVNNSCICGYNNQIAKVYGTAYVEYCCVVGIGNEIGKGNVVNSYVFGAGCAIGSEETSDVDNCYVVGEGNFVGTSVAQYSYVFGISNIVGGSLGTSYSNWIIGLGNQIADTGGETRNSYIFGDSNRVTRTFSTAYVEFCYVIGKNNDIGRGNVVHSYLFGESSSIGGAETSDVDNCYIVGEGNIVGESSIQYGYIFGTSNLVGNGSGSSFADCVIGNANTVGLADSDYCYVFGYQNNVGTDAATNCVCIGFLNNIGYGEAVNDSVCIGFSNEIGVYESVSNCFLFGKNLKSHDSYSTLFGIDNTVNVGAQYSMIPGGQFAIARWYGEHVFASYRFGGDETYNGTGQIALQPLSGITSDDSWHELDPDGGDGVGAIISIEDTSSYYFDIMVVARRCSVNSQTVTWRAECHVERSAGTTALVGKSVTRKFETANGDEADWDCDIDIDDITDKLQVKVLGKAAQTIYWQAGCRVVELSTKVPPI